MNLGYGPITALRLMLTFTSTNGCHWLKRRIIHAGYMDAETGLSSFYHGTLLLQQYDLVSVTKVSSWLLRAVLRQVLTGNFSTARINLTR